MLKFNLSIKQCPIFDSGFNFIEKNSTHRIKLFFLIEDKFNLSLFIKNNYYFFLA